MNNIDLGKWAQLAKDFLGSDFFNEVIDDSKSEDDNGEGHQFASDVYHEDDTVIVMINIPGMKDINSVKWQVDGDSLTIQGACPDIYSEYNVFVSQRKKGEFEHSIQLGVEVEPTHKYSRYYRGILELHFTRKA